MKIVQVLKRMVLNSEISQQLLRETVAGIANQSGLLNNKLEALIVGVANQSRLLNEKFGKTIEGLETQSELFGQRIEELIASTDNQSTLLNDKLMAIVHRQDALIALQKAEIAALRGASGDAGLATIQVPPAPSVAPPPEKAEPISFAAAMKQLPLMIDAKTYNTSHPDYDATIVRNFPGKIFNADQPCDNLVYANLQKLANGNEVQDQAWNAVLKAVLEEAETVPHSDQVFERRAYIEKYLKEITQRYSAHYAPGWVNLDDALFLYWLVRKLNPKTIVQTGVCNGLSSAFMMLALVKNGDDGRLHVIDLPPVFNSKDAAWTVKGKVYGVVIPEGKSSGWMVPDAYRSRFEVQTGDAKVLLPKMVDSVDSIDLFYHDSDHTYDHMMFEFREAKRKLRPGGLIVADDVSWNASVWDFADQYGLPAYNFKGAVGVAFLPREQAATATRRAANN
jgi:predicted O-methyltransferase YrrM